METNRSISTVNSLSLLRLFTLLPLVASNGLPTRAGNTPAVATASDSVSKQKVKRMLFYTLASVLRLRQTVDLKKSKRQMSEPVTLFTLICLNVV